MDAPIDQNAEEGPSLVRDASKELAAQVLQGYLQEAKEARAGGPNPRDAKWEETLNLYWNRYDFSDKEEWQSQEVTGEVPAFVDRFAAALKEAHGVVGEAMFTVVDPGDKQNALAKPIKRMTDTWLSRVGRNANSQPLGFEAVFEDQMKLAALMAASSVTLWREDVAHGRVAIETVDPRDVWIDHTSRGLYRFRRSEIDRHKLAGFLKGANAGLYNEDEVLLKMQQMIAEAEHDKESLVGHGAQVGSGRPTLELYEFLGDIVTQGGEVLAEKALAYLAGDYVIRGPEKNPFWHGRDWLNYTPLVTVPLSPYGRGYAEDFGSLARTYNKFTNLIFDAVSFSSVRSFATIPEMLRDESQLEGGFRPGKNFELQLGVGDVTRFVFPIEMGSLSPDTITVWQSLKNALTEAAHQNEVGLGQFAPNSRTSATEISETQQSSNAVIRSIAQTIEHRWLEPTYDSVWKTGLQHVSPKDQLLRDAAGSELFDALLGKRRELIQRPITFQARGLSTLIYRSQKLRTLIQVLQVIASNELMLQQFIAVVDMQKLVRLLFELANLDFNQLEKSQTEMLMQSFSNALQPAGGPSGSPPRPAQEVARTLGVAR